MKTETYEGTISSAYGEPVNPPIKFSGEYQAVENKAEIPASELPTDEDICEYVNNKRKAAARQKSINAAQDAAGIKKPTNEDPKVAFKNIVAALVAQGRSQEAAEQAAKMALGL